MFCRHPHSVQWHFIQQKLDSWLSLLLKSHNCQSSIIINVEFDFKACKNMQKHARILCRYTDRFLQVGFLVEDKNLLQCHVHAWYSVYYIKIRYVKCILYIICSICDTYTICSKSAIYMIYTI